MNGGSDWVRSGELRASRRTPSRAGLTCASGYASSFLNVGSDCVRSRELRASRGDSKMFKVFLLGFQDFQYQALRQMIMVMVFLNMMCLMDSMRLTVKT